MQVALYFGHHIGLAAADPQIDDARLEPGMVLTVEPWYYDRARGLAAFTEDMVLVTATGALNLTASLPRSAAALETAVKADSRRPRPR
jgi:Xaa-Pro aminopeptidase